MAIETEATGADLVDWRALVRKLARNARTTASEFSREDEIDLDQTERWLAMALELDRLGNWLDSLVGVEMKVNIHANGKIRGSG